MRFDELLEGRDAPLYHWMDANKARRVFLTDTVRAMFAHKIVGQRGVSLSRNKRYVHHNGTAVCLVLDQAKLTQTHRIVPLDSEHAIAIDNDEAGEPGGLLPAADRHQWSASAGEETAEEYVVGSIRSLHRYLTAILVKDHNDANFIRPMLVYAKRFNTPVKVLDNPEYFHAAYNDDAERWHRRRLAGEKGWRMRVRELQLTQ